MFKFQYKLTTLNFLTCANLHMIEKTIYIYIYIYIIIVFYAVSFLEIVD